MFLPKEELELLRREAELRGIPLGEGELAAFEAYAAFLVEYNEKVNLTAITDPRGIVIKHFLDSLLLTKAVELPKGARLIDVGTGAGFPAVPVKILRPDVEVTLLDSLNKRIVFLAELSRRLGQGNEALHLRAEEGGRLPKYREGYDLATARAVAELRVLAEYCLPFVKVGGAFVALKGPDCGAEVEAAGAAIQKLGGKLERSEEYSLPDENRRTLIVIRKVSQTPPAYPRTAAKMAKSPL